MFFIPNDAMLLITLIVASIIGWKAMKFRFDNEELKATETAEKYKEKQKKIRFPHYLAIILVIWLALFVFGRNLWFYVPGFLLLMLASSMIVWTMHQARKGWLEIIVGTAIFFWAGFIGLMLMQYGLNFHISWNAYLLPFAIMIIATAILLVLCLYRYWRANRRIGRRVI